MENMQFFEKENTTKDVCFNGIINQFKNIIGLNFDKNLDQNLILLEPGHFYPLFDYKDFYLEIFHNRKIKFVFHITYKSIFYYVDEGIIMHYKDRDYINLNPINNVILNNENINYELFDLLYKKTEQIRKENMEREKINKKTKGNIILTNKSSLQIYISIVENGIGSSQFYLLNSDTSDTWIRYKSQKISAYINYPDNTREEYILGCPGKYELLEKNYIFNVIENIIIPYKTFVKIDNGTNCTIFVKLLSNGIGEEEEYHINSMSYENWIRYSGELKLQIRDGTSSFIYRFIINSPGYYKYIGEGIILDNYNEDELIIHDENMEISDFKSTIYVRNISPNAIFVRITSNGIGSEDLFQLEPNQGDTWKRFCKDFIMEIVELNEINYKYKVFCQGNYSYLGNGILIDNMSKNECFADKNLKINCLSRCEIRINADEKPNDDNYNKFKNIKFIQDCYYPFEDTKILIKNSIQKFEDFNIIQEKSDFSKEICLFPYYDNKNPIFIKDHFFDIHFPPEIRTINSLDENGSPSSFHFYEANKKPYLPTNNIGFKKASEIYGNDYDLLKFIDPSDPIQGHLGDCYLISVLSSLATKPSIVKKIFKSSIVNPYGFYEICFYDGIEKKQMFIDDYFAVDLHKGDPFFCKNKKNQLWSLLLEKALAKFENGYSNIHCGNSKCSYQFFTGANTRWIRNLDYKSTWNEILYASNNKHLMVSGTRGKNHYRKDKYGIHNEHTYTILDAKEFLLKKQSKQDILIRLIKLRNPWGYANVQTEFSLESKIWSEEMKNFFNYNEANTTNGIFFISYEIFIECFKDLTICYI